MNTASAHQEKNPEHAREETDLKAKLKELIGLLTYDERKLVKESKWQDTNKDWDEGFLEFIEKDVQKNGKSGMITFQDFVKHLRRDYENMSSSEDPNDKKLAKARYELAEKILGIYSKDHEPEEKKKKEAKEAAKSIYGWENIKFTLRNIRRQVFELFGGKDPWWDYNQEQAGMAQTQKQVLGNTKSTEMPQEKPVTQSTPVKAEVSDDAEFEAWKTQKSSDNDGRGSQPEPSHETHTTPPEEKKAA